MSARFRSALFGAAWALGLVLCAPAQAASLRFSTSSLTPAALPTVDVTVSGASVFSGPTSGFTIPVNTTGRVVIRIRSLPDYQVFEGWAGICAGLLPSLPCEFDAGQPVLYDAGAVIRNRTGTLRFTVRTVDLVSAPLTAGLDQTASPDGTTGRVNVGSVGGPAPLTTVVGTYAFTALSVTNGNCVQAPLQASLSAVVQEGRETVVDLGYRADRCAVAVEADRFTNGTVLSTPAGIDCPFGPVDPEAGSNCAAFFPFGSTARLAPTPSPGFAFAGWASGCRPTLKRVCDAVAQPSVSAKRPGFVAASGGSADLAIDAADLRVDDAGGGKRRFSLTVRNLGAGTASSVKAELGATQPGALGEIPTLVSDGGSCDAVQFCRWTLGELAAGQSRTVSFTAAGTRADFALTGCTLGSSADPAPGNDCASAVATIGGAPPPPPGPATVAIGTRSPADTTTAKGAADVPALQFTVSPPAGVTAGHALTGLVLSVSGSGQDALDLLAVRVYADDNGNGVVDAAEKAVPIASGRFDADDGTLRLAVTPTDLGSGRSFLVALDVNTTIASAGAPVALAGLALGVVAVGRVGARRRRVQVATGALAIAALVAACGGGGGGGGGGTPPPVTRSFRITLLEVQAAAQGQAVVVTGTPFAGALLTVEK